MIGGDDQDGIDRDGMRRGSEWYWSLKEIYVSLEDSVMYMSACVRASQNRASIRFCLGRRSSLYRTCRKPDGMFKSTSWH